MSNKTPSIIGVKDTSEVRINPATEDAQISGNASLSAIESDIDDIKGKTDQFTFTGDSLKVATTISISAVGLNDSSDVRINPAKEDGNLASIKLNTDKFTFASSRLIIDGSNVVQPVSGTITADIGITNGLLLDTTFTGRINTQGQKAMSASTPVVIASDQSAIPVSQSGVWDIGEVTSITGTVTTAPTTSTSSSVAVVSRSNANQTLLSSNASRKGATIYNDSGANLFVKLGSTASTSSFTIRLQSNDYYEVPFSYTGQIDGIWASNGAGDAKITELS